MCDACRNHFQELLRTALAPYADVIDREVRHRIENYTETDAFRRRVDDQVDEEKREVMTPVRQAFERLVELWADAEITDNTTLAELSACVLAHVKMGKEFDKITKMLEIEV